MRRQDNHYDAETDCNHKQRWGRSMPIAVHEVRCEARAGGRVQATENLLSGRTGRSRANSRRQRQGRALARQDTPHNWISQQSRASISDEGLSVAATGPA
jgi:hypothetical protein